jgi:molybdate transport system ATP-binding protein
LLKSPKIIILNEPYAGLDSESIDILDTIFLDLAKNGLNIILCSAIDHMPAFITNTLILNHKEIKFSYKPEIQVSNAFPYLFRTKSKIECNYNTAFSLNNLTIYDGPKKILDNINWKVQKGEKWALLGKNGAGKSILLSIIFADHPQAYSNQVLLFDKPRGTGESIWEIREKIGYFSSELFLYADKNKTCRELAYSQIKSNPYKFVPITNEDEKEYLNLMCQFSLEKYIDIPIHYISSTMQRLALLLAIFMKNPPLLILDEPFHGFDLTLIAKLKDFLNLYCKDRTFIFVTHQKKEIPAIINKYFHLVNGKAGFNLV